MSYTTSDAETLNPIDEIIYQNTSSKDVLKENLQEAIQW